MSSAWWTCKISEESVRHNIETGIAKWVKSLIERGLLNGGLTEQDELADYIIKEFEPDKEIKNVEG